MKGYLNLVLHAHLPFVYNADEQYHLEERWFYEALAECYLPLLIALERLEGDGVPFCLTVSFSPTLLCMLDHPVMAGRFEEYLRRMVRLAESETYRTAGDGLFNQLARYYLERYRFLYSVYTERCQRDLLSVFARLAERGRLELITTCATHGYLPLMKTAEAVKAQVAVGLKTFKGRFGYMPRGIWLPECGYFPGLDRILVDLGISYTFVDTHGLQNAFPTPHDDVYAPVRTKEGLAVFARDPETSVQVWSMDSGYPGDPEYREYYRDIGFDLDTDYLRRFIPYSVRVNTGIKYYRVTGKGPYKEIYNPERALARAREHAGNFHFNRTKQLEYLAGACRMKPVITAPYDAELFGHWWFEGPQFLEEVFRMAAAHQEAFSLTTPSRYLETHGCRDTVELYLSSWGEGGYSRAWLNPSNDWLYPQYHRAESALASHRLEAESGSLWQRAYNQAVKELLLAQSSDWAFMINAGTTVEYARRRVLGHLENFQELDNMLSTGKFDLSALSRMETRTAGLFADMDVSAFIQGPACSTREGWESPSVLMMSWEYPPQIMGGLSRHVDDLSRALTNAGVPVSVLTSRGADSPLFEMNGRVCVYRVAPPQHAGEEIDFHDWVVQLNLGFYNLAQKIIPADRYAILHAHDWLVGTAAMALQRAFRLPLVVTIHATEYGRNNGLHTPLQRRIHEQEKKLVTAANRVICCSRYMAREVVNLFAIPPSKVTVIENGVMPEKVLAPPLTGEDRRRYAGDEEKIVFFVGRLVREKGVETLLSALALVLTGLPGVKAVVSGKGPMLDELRKLAKEAGISGRVLFTGFISDYERNRLFATADAAVFPSLYEPFGIVALEAMAAGTPLVVSDVGGMGEVVEHGVDGLKVKPGDPRALAEAITLLLRDQELGQKLGQNAKTKVRTVYSWNRLALQTKQLYRKVFEEAMAANLTHQGGG